MTKSQQSEHGGPPVLLFVFANDDRPGRQLDGLRREIEGIRRALAPAERHGLCELVVRESTTPQEFTEVIEDRRYRSRLALVHFAGHANPSNLLLEGEGEPVSARIQGLAPLLAEIGCLAVVVLNGCSTLQQGRRLVERGIPAVVATEHVVEDRRARRFAVDFYRSMAAGEALETAFERAIHQSECFGSSQGASRDLAPSPRREPHAPPWQLLLAEPEDDAKAWSLPSAANEPLFGVPEPRAGALPQEPFMGLRRFEARDSAVFFGRGQAIRNLYDDVTAATIPHLMVVYGASGVGKSSLLEAGLLPRLAVEHEVHVLRLQRGQDPVPLLRRALDDSGAVASLGESWLARERAAGRPIVICIDQLELLMLEDHGGKSLGRFVSALEPLFDPRQRPRGKLVLSLRKEWFPELLNEMRRQGALWHEHFVKPLDRDEIRDVVLGPTRTASLRSRYGITCEAGLAARIADDLLGDRESAVAPVLQILLTRLWTRTTPSPSATTGRIERHFTLALYDELRREGLALSDFVDRQLESLQRTHAEESSSGLVLDLLYWHTTARGTATSHTYTDLAEYYAHRWPDVRGVIEYCVSLYLLLPVNDRSGGEVGVRLAHDTLAPIIRDRYQESKAPGQAAARLLQARIGMAGLSRRSRVLDEHDLEQVEAARTGMRRWTDEEEQLVVASRVHRTRTAWGRRARQLVMLATIIVATTTLAMRSESEPEVVRSKAMMSPSPSEEPEPSAEWDRSTTLTLVPAQVEGTSTGSDAEVQPADEIAATEPMTGPPPMNDLSPAPHWRSNARATRRRPSPSSACKKKSYPTGIKDVGVLAVNASGQRIALAGKNRKTQIFSWSPVDGEATKEHLIPTAAFVNHLAWSPDGDVLALGQRGGNLELVDWTSGTASAPVSHPGHEKAISALAFSKKGGALLSADKAGVVIVRRGSGYRSTTLLSIGWWVYDAQLVSRSKWLLAGAGGHLEEWDETSLALSTSFPSTHTNVIHKAKLLKGHRVLATGTHLQLWGPDTRVLSNKKLGAVASALHVLDDGDYVLTTGAKSVDLWHWPTGILSRADRWEHEGIEGIAVRTEVGDVFALDSAGSIHWLVRQDNELIEKTSFRCRLSHSGHILADPEGRYLVVGHSNGEVSVVTLSPP